MIYDVTQFHPCLAPSIFALGKAAAAVLSTATVAAFLPRLLKKATPDCPHDNLDFGDTTTRLRLRSPEMKPFAGHNLDWESWCATATSTFISAGFGGVVADDCDGSTP